MIEGIRSAVEWIETSTRIKALAVASGPTATLYLTTQDCTVDYFSPHMIGAFIVGSLTVILTSMLIYKEVRILRTE